MRGFISVNVKYEENLLSDYKYIDIFALKQHSKSADSM